MSATLNIFDLVFLSFLVIFVLTAFFRGFIKEIFALFNWILSLFLSYLITPYATEFLEPHFHNKLIVDIAARSIIFVIVFFVTALSTSSLCKALKDKIPKYFDRSLGVLYGIIKTLLIFGFIYSITSNFYGSLLGENNKKDSQQLPSWLSEAKSYNILKIVGTALDPLVKKVFDEVMKNFDQVVPQSKKLDEKIDQVIDQQDSNQSPFNPEELDSGYSKKEIEKMNRLIEIIDK